MYDPNYFYNLYCINIHCNVSVYNKIEKVLLPLTEENLLAAHACPCCGQTLVSAIDSEISCIMAQVNSRNQSFLNN